MEKIEILQKMIERTQSQIQLLTERGKTYQQAISNDIDRLHEDLYEQNKLLKEFKDEQ